MCNHCKDRTTTGCFPVLQPRTFHRYLWGRDGVGDSRGWHHCSAHYDIQHLFIAPIWKTACETNIVLMAALCWSHNTSHSPAGIGLLPVSRPWFSPHPPKTWTKKKNTDKTRNITKSCKVFKSRWLVCLTPRVKLKGCQVFPNLQYITAPRQAAGLGAPQTIIRRSSLLYIIMYEEIV